MAYVTVGCLQVNSDCFTVQSFTVSFWIWITKVAVSSIMTYTPANHIGPEFLLMYVPGFTRPPYLLLMIRQPNDKKLFKCSSGLTGQQTRGWIHSGISCSKHLNKCIIWNGTKVKQVHCILDYL